MDHHKILKSINLNPIDTQAKEGNKQRRTATEAL